jgi:hypothetical protein
MRNSEPHVPNIPYWSWRSVDGRRRIYAMPAFRYIEFILDITKNESRNMYFTPEWFNMICMYRPFLFNSLHTHIIEKVSCKGLLQQTANGIFRFIDAEGCSSRESDRRITVLARTSSNCKRQTRPVVREGVQHKTNPQLSDSNKNVVFDPWWMIYTKTDWPTDCRSYHNFGLSGTLSQLRVAGVRSEKLVAETGNISGTQRKRKVRCRKPLPSNGYWRLRRFPP